MGTTKNTLKMLTVFLTLTLTLTPNLTEYHHQVTVVKLVIARRAGGAECTRGGMSECETSREANVRIATRLGRCAGRSGELTHARWPLVSKVDDRPTDTTRPKPHRTAHAARIYGFLGIYCVQ